MTDTSSSQARKGKDVQGIPWDRLNITREKYRLTRLEQYRNYQNIPLSGEAVDKVCYRRSFFGALSFLSWLLMMRASFVFNFYCHLSGVQANGERRQLLWIFLQYKIGQTDNPSFSGW